MDATLAGGTGTTPLLFHYNASDSTLAQAKLLAASVDESSSSAKYYIARQQATTPGYSLAAGQNLSYLTSAINIAGFGGVTVRSNGTEATVLGGGNSASVGGGATGAAIGDSVKLGAGPDTITLPITAGSVGTVQSHTLSFVAAGSTASVLGGAAKAGGNLIAAGTGTVTLFGAGNGDSLTGGAGKSDIVAGTGNETLVAGQGDTTLVGAGTSGQDVFKFTPEGHPVGVTDIVKDFAHGSDAVDVSAYGPGAVDHALSTFKVENGNGSFTLPDGTTVRLEGVTDLTKHDFKS